MSYDTLEEIPFNVRRCYNEADLKVWQKEYNDVFNKLKSGKLERPSGYANDAMYAREKAFTACKDLPSSRYLKAQVTAEVLDSQGEVADVDAYADGMEEYIDFGGIGIESHSSKVISTVWKTEKGVDQATGKPCIISYENYFRGHKLYDSVWNAVLDGVLAEKSIGSRKDTERTHMECDEEGCHTRLYPDQVFEISSVFRGANPRTGRIDIHEAIKSFGNINIVELNTSEKMCPCKKNYLEFKDEVLKADSTANVHYLPDGTIYIRTKSASQFADAVLKHYPEASMSHSHHENMGDITFINRGKGEYRDLDVFNELMRQVEGENEAIEGYVKAMKFIDQTQIAPEKKDFLKKVLKEIISDEERHIGTLNEAVEVFNEEIHGLLEEGEEEAEEISEKSETMGDCPPGQHRHAGVEGCHDSTRPHPGMDGMASDPKDAKALVLSQIPTQKLHDILVSITAMLQQYPDDKVDVFLTSPSGKKYMMLYAEYMRRRKVSDNTENNMEQEPTALKEDSGLSADAVTSFPSQEDANHGPIPDLGGTANTSVSSPAPEGSEAPAQEAPAQEAPAQTQDAEPTDQPATEESPKDDKLKGDLDLVSAIDNISSMMVFMKSKMEAMCSRLDGLENMQKLEMDQKNTMPDTIMGEMSAPAPASSPVANEEEGKGEVPPITEESDTPSAVQDADANPESTAGPDNKEVPPTDNAPTADKPAEASSDKEPPAKSEDKPADKPAEPPAKKDEPEPKKDEAKDKPPEKKEDKLKSDQIIIDALKARIAELEGKGISVDGVYEGNNLSSGQMAYKTSSPNITLVDTPAPTFEMPKAGMFTSKSLMDDLFRDLTTQDPKTFSENLIRRYE